MNENLQSVTALGSANPQVREIKTCLIVSEKMFCLSANRVKKKKKQEWKNETSMH